LAVDLRAGLDVDLLDGQTLRAGLLGHETLSKHACRRGAHSANVAHHLDSPRLSASPGVHLGFHHPDRTAQGLGRRSGFLRRRGHLSCRDCDAVASENFLRLILVQIHPVPSSWAKIPSGCAPREIFAELWPSASPPGYAPRAKDGAFAGVPTLRGVLAQTIQF